MFPAVIYRVLRRLQHEWQIEQDGREVHCFGTNRGEIAKAIWSDGGWFYSVYVRGDEGAFYALSEDDLRMIVAGVK